MQRTLSKTALALTLALASLSGSAFASTAEKIAAVQAARFDLTQAIQSAQSQHGLKVLQAEIDTKKKQPIYEVSGINAQGREIKLKFSALDAAQVLENKDDGAAEKKDSDRLAAAKISISDAIATALKHTPGKAIEVDLDDHLGVLTYDVKIINAANTEVEVRVHAINGNIHQ